MSSKQRGLNLERVFTAPALVSAGNRCSLFSTLKIAFYFHLPMVLQAAWLSINKKPVVCFSILPTLLGSKHLVPAKNIFLANIRGQLT